MAEKPMTLTMVIYTRVSICIIYLAIQLMNALQELPVRRLDILQIHRAHGRKGLLRSTLTTTGRGTTFLQALLRLGGVGGFLLDNALGYVRNVQHAMF